MSGTINGSPQPGHDPEVALTSAVLNADGKLPAPRPYTPGTINGSPQPGHDKPVVITPGNTKA